MNKHGIWAIVRGRVKWPGKLMERGGKPLGEAVLDLVPGRGEPSTVKVSGWSDAAEAVGTLRKGAEVEVHGWLSLNHWVNKDGLEVWQNQITAVEVVMLDREPAREPTKPAALDDDDSIPF